MQEVCVSEVLRPHLARHTTVRDGTVGAVRYNSTVPLPADLPPRLAFAAQRALRFPAEIHTDSCGWMGADFPHPCTCGMPALVRWLVERFGLGDDALIPSRHRNQDPMSR